MSLYDWFVAIVVLGGFAMYVWALWEQHVPMR